MLRDFFRTYHGSVMNSMLVWMSDNQAGGADAATHFLKIHEDVWTTWVDVNVAVTVKASL